MAAYPIRVQRRCVAGWQMPENTIYVGRRSRWENPFTSSPHHEIGASASVMTRFGFCMEIDKWLTDRDVVWIFSHWIEGEYTRDAEINALLIAPWMQRPPSIAIDVVPTLRGKNLACWCPLSRPCHADVLLQIANR